MHRLFSSQQADRIDRRYPIGKCSALICRNVYNQTRPLPPVLDAFFRVLADTANGIPDPRLGPNLRFALLDGVLWALAAFHLHFPSFLAFEKALRNRRFPSFPRNCAKLFRLLKRPSAGAVRAMLDGLCPTDFDTVLLFSLFWLARRKELLQPFLPFDGRIVVALDAVEMHQSRKIHCPLCSVRHTGADRKPQYFHVMLVAVAVSASLQRVLPLGAEFVRPQDSAASSRRQQKQDCERNAAKRLVPRLAKQLRGFRPVFLGDALYCCQSICDTVPGAGADFPFVTKPGSNRHMHRTARPETAHFLPWHATRLPDGRREFASCRWRTNVPVRKTADAVRGTWIEYRSRRNGIPYHCTFFTSLAVNAGNVLAVARLGRERWRVENEGFNNLTNAGYHFKHNFGHGRDGLCEVLATLNLIAFGLHTLLELCDDHWQATRSLVRTLRGWFAELTETWRRYELDSWRDLLRCIRDPGSRAPPPPQPGEAAAA